MGATLSSIIGLFDGSPMRGLAVGLRVGTSGVGIALGPVIGGILLQRFAWDSVFWVCAVIGTLAISGSLPGTLRRLLDDSVASAFMDGLHSICLATMTIALIAAVVAIVAMPKRR